jgi:hypothetical protein
MQATIAHAWPLIEIERPPTDRLHRMAVHGGDFSPDCDLLHTISPPMLLIHPDLTPAKRANASRVEASRINANRDFKTKRRMIMRTQTNVATVIAVALALAAPATAFAQATFHPSWPTVNRWVAPADTIVTDPHGQVIGADPDANVRHGLRRDWDQNR